MGKQISGSVGLLEGKWRCDLVGAVQSCATCHAVCRTPCQQLALLGLSPPTEPSLCIPRGLHAPRDALGQAPSQHHQRSRF